MCTVWYWKLFLLLRTNIQVLAYSLLRVHFHALLSDMVLCVYSIFWLHHVYLGCAGPRVHGKGAETASGRDDHAKWLEPAHEVAVLQGYYTPAGISKTAGGASRSKKEVCGQCSKGCKTARAEGRTELYAGGGFACAMIKSHKLTPSPPKQNKMINRLALDIIVSDGLWTSIVESLFKQEMFAV